MQLGPKIVPNLIHRMCIPFLKFFDYLMEFNLIESSVLVKGDGGVGTFDVGGGGLPSFLVQIFQFFGCTPN